MSTPNINCILQAIAVVLDQNNSNFPQLVNFDLLNPTLPGTVSYFDPYFQAPLTGKVVPLPAATVFGLVLQNKDPTNILTISFTIPPAEVVSQNLGIGGVFIYFDPAKTGGGISAMTLTGNVATVAVSILAVG